MTKKILPFTDFKANLYFLNDQDGNEYFGKWSPRHPNESKPEKIYRDTNGNGTWDRDDEFIAPDSEAYQTLLTNCLFSESKSLNGISVQLLGNNLASVKELKELNAAFNPALVTESHQDDLIKLQSLVAKFSQGYLYSRPETQRILNDLGVREKIYDGYVALARDTIDHSPVSLAGLEGINDLLDLARQFHTPDLAGAQTHETLINDVGQDRLVGYCRALIDTTITKINESDWHRRHDSESFNHWEPVQKLLKSAQDMGLKFPDAQRQAWGVRVVESEVVHYAASAIKAEASYSSNRYYDFGLALKPLIGSWSATLDLNADELNINFWQHQKVFPDFMQPAMCEKVMALPASKRLELFNDESTVKDAMQRYRNGDHTALNTIICALPLLPEDQYEVSRFLYGLSQSHAPADREFAKKIGRYEYGRHLASGQSSSSSMAALLELAGLLSEAEFEYRKVFADQKIAMPDRIEAAQAIKRIDESHIPGDYLRAKTISFIKYNANLVNLSTQCQARLDYYKILRLLLDNGQIATVAKLVTTEQGKRFGADKDWNGSELVGNGNDAVSGVE